MLACATPLAALTFNVDTTADTPDANTADGVCADGGGNCSLRAAVMQSNASSGSDTINLPAGTYSLTIGSASSDLDASVGDLDLSSGGVSFVGASADTTIIDASGISHRIFQIPVDLFFSGSVSFSDLTLQGGNSSGVGGGAAIDAGSRFAASLNLTRVVVTSNTGGSAIRTLTDTVINESVVSNNSGNGLFQTNDAVNPGDNIKTLDIADSTFEGNGLSGIAIGNNDGGSLVNSTMSGNGSNGVSAQFTGGTDFVITNSTIASNGLDGISGVGYTFSGFPVRPDILVRNSIIADNVRSDVTTPALDAQAEVPQSDGFNVVSDNSAAGNFTGPSDLNNTDPMLLPIALNAPGATRTHALSPDSPAVDLASASYAPGTDQRGVTRPQGAGDDSGAYEFEPTFSDLGVGKTADVASAGLGDPVVFTIVVANSGPDAVTGALVSDDPGPTFTNASWTCSASAGSSCTASGGGAIGDLADILAGGQVTYTLNTVVAMDASAGIADNTAEVTLPGGAADPNPPDNADTASVEIIDLPPTAVDDVASVLEDSGTTTIDVLANDTDPDGGPLMIMSATQPADGSVVVAPDGLSLSYTPDAETCNDGAPTDDFGYTLNGGSSATVAVSVACVNDAPSFVPGPDPMLPGGTTGPQSFTGWVVSVDFGGGEAQAVDSYAVAIVDDPAGILSGGVSIATNGTLSFTLTGAGGTAQLEATVTDDGGTANGGQDTSPPVAFSIDVANEPPVANDDTVTLNEDEAPTVMVAANDTDADGNLNPASANTSCGSCSSTANGVLLNNGDGSFTYTPQADFFGADSFDYEICDSANACDTATVDITVDPVNDPPTFSAGASPSFPAGTSGAQSIDAWPQDIDLGSGEPQAVAGYAVSIVDDPGGILSGPAAISNAGTLSFTLTGAGGVARLEVTLMDDGGTANGGDDLSDPVPFLITVGDALADLAASTLRCSEFAAPEESYAYSFVITNNGPDAVAGVMATHETIAGASINGVSSPDCVISATTVDCDLGVMAAGSVVQVGVSIQVPDVGAQTLTMTTEVVTTSATGDPVPGNGLVETPVEIVPGLITADAFQSCLPAPD
jgi:uncharacterized repeat protein (TIGR01451 family)/CSLREA domain-containing protein